MKLKNIKAHFMLDAELEVCTKRKIFRGNAATFTIHNHHKDVIHVTGVKSHSHLKSCLKYLEETYKVKIEKTVIDNQFISHKDNKVVNLKRIYDDLRHNKKYHVIFEPELFAGMTIKNIDKKYPTILLFHTGSFTLLGGKMENVKYTSNFLKKILHNNTVM